MTFNWLKQNLKILTRATLRVRYAKLFGLKANRDMLLQE